jgi:hypothetical protein
LRVKHHGQLIPASEPFAGAIAVMRLDDFPELSLRDFFENLAENAIREVHGD